MTRLKLVISDEAIADLIDIWSYVAEGNPERADTFIEEIHAKCEALLENPLIGRERSALAPGIRSFPVGRYLIFYRISAETVQVARILSGYRDLDSAFN